MLGFMVISEKNLNLFSEINSKTEYLFFLSKFIIIVINKNFSHKTHFCFHYYMLSFKIKKTFVLVC